MTAPCATRPDLFEATTRAAHEEARVKCADCPLRDACAANLRDTIATWGYDLSNGPRGTWAGTLLTGQPVALGGAA